MRTLRSVLTLTLATWAAATFALGADPALAPDTSAYAKLSVDARTGRKLPIVNRVDSGLLDLHVEHRQMRARIGSATRFRSERRPMARVDADDRVLLDAVATGSTERLQGVLVALGMRVTGANGRIVSGWLPLNRVPQLATLPELMSARPSTMMTWAGSVTSQGDTALRTAAMRASAQVDGSGITVGVLSDSFNCKGGAAGDAAAGDLPGAVALLKEAPDCAVTQDEGRAMMQIVHDLAPGAGLSFYTAYGGMADFANGIAALKSGGAQVLVDDVIYLAEPMFQDGIIAQAVDAAVAQGATYFSAAGNLARQSYESAFRATGVRGRFPTSKRHNFDASGVAVDTLQSVTIPVGATATFILQWDEPFFSVSGSPGCTKDLDLVLYDATGNVVAPASANTNNIGGDAVEVLTYVNPGPATAFQLAIEQHSPSNGPFAGRVKYVFFANPGATITLNEYQSNSSTLWGHANAAGARAVGAANYNSTPAFGVSPPVLQAYSARGGTQILFGANGTRLPQAVDRGQPSVVAVDGVSTTVPGFASFFGTSAAAPHAAGVAALLRQYGAGAGAAQIYTSIQASGIDMGAGGYDSQNGYGLVQADVARQHLAATLGINAVAQVPVPAWASVSLAAVVLAVVRLRGRQTLQRRSTPASRPTRCLPRTATAPSLRKEQART